MSGREAMKKALISVLAVLCLAASATAQTNWATAVMMDSATKKFLDPGIIVSNNLVTTTNTYVITNAASAVYAQIAGVSSNVTAGVTNSFDGRYLGIGSNAVSASYASVAALASNVTASATNAFDGRYLGIGSNAASATAASYASVANLASNALRLGGVLASNYPTFSVLSSTAPGAAGMDLIGTYGSYNLHDLEEDVALRGASRDQPTFVYTVGFGGLTVSWTKGDVFDPENGYYHLIAGTNVLVDFANNYAYWTPSAPNVVSWTTGNRPPVTNSIYLGVFNCSFGQIIGADAATAIGDLPAKVSDAHSYVFPSIVVSGLQHTPTGTNLNAIAMSGGTEYHDMTGSKTHGAQNLANTNLTAGIKMFAHTNAGAWGVFTTNQFPIGVYDNGTNLVAISDTNTWYRGLFSSLPGYAYMVYVAPSAVYTSYVDAVSADDPSEPPGFEPYTPRCTAYVFQGGDTALRNDLSYWLDRRFMIRRGALVTGSGSSSSVPNLFQVLLQGAGTGGILPSGAGLPSSPDQLTSKAYVDSTINNINAGKAYVDIKNGNDGTALLEDSTKPFKTVQAAIDAASAVASATNRFLVNLSAGSFAEDVTMKNFVGMRADDIESTVINGTVTWPPAYTDEVGSEVALLTISSTNKPAVVMNSGADDGYMGIRSCFVRSAYDNGQSNKSVVVISRGVGEVYGTTYNELDLYPTNGSGAVRNAQIYEHVTDPANEGLSQLAVFGSSDLIDCRDANDNVASIYTHDNTDAACINTVQAGVLRVFMNEPGVSYSNDVRLVSHERAIGRTLAQGRTVRLDLSATNSCNVFVAYATQGTGDNVAISRNNHIRITSGWTSNIWIGASTGTNDSIRVYDTEFIQNLSDYPYPRKYTAVGALGKFFYNTASDNGDHLFGSAVDMSAENTTFVSRPEVGHLKLYAGTYAGLENPYYTDSSGNIVRISRDSFYNGYNAETTTLHVGEAVYISSGLSPDATPKVKRSVASDLSTLPCMGLVAQVGGIATGTVGRVMIMGRMESTMDTSAFASGDKLYLRADLPGGLTNVAPYGDGVFAQIIGTCHVSSTNGRVNVRPWAVDALGGLAPSAYVTNGTEVANVNALTLQGYTPEQLSSAQLTYYIWGSLAGPYTNHMTRLAQIDSPVGLPVQTNLFAAVTNGQDLTGVSIRLDELPRILTKGVVYLKNVTSRSGDASERMISAKLTVYESNQTTVVQQFVGGDTVPCPQGITMNNIGISITNDVSLTDHGRYVLVNTYLVSGWTGAETISVYSQNGYLARVEIPGGGGVYVTHSEADGPLNWVAANSNSLNLQGVLDGGNAATQSMYLASTSGVSAVRGEDLSGAGYGVEGDTESGTGVYGLATGISGWGVNGDATEGIGVLGYDNGTNAGIGVMGLVESGAYNVGVEGFSRGGTGSVGGWLYNSDAQGLALLFRGRIGRLAVSSYTNVADVVDLVDSNGLVYSGGKVVLTGLTSVAYASVAGVASNVTSGVTNSFDLRYLGIGSNAVSASYASVAAVASNVTVGVTNSLDGRYLGKGSNAVSASYASVAAVASNVTSGVTNAFDLRYIGIGSNAVSASYASVAGVASNVTAGVTNSFDLRYLGIGSNAVSASYASTANNASNLGGYASSVYVTNTASIRFKAGLQTNFTLSTGSDAKFPFTNVVLAASGGSTYDATNSRWYPRTTGKVIEFMGGASFPTVANGVVYNSYLYKNGTNYAALKGYRSANAADAWTFTWTYVDVVNTSTNDYYEVFYNQASGGATTSAGARSNNWWFGNVE